MPLPAIEGNHLRVRRQSRQRRDRALRNALGGSLLLECRKPRIEIAAAWRGHDLSGLQDDRSSQDGNAKDECDGPAGSGSHVALLR
jgi:hypothetical protein